LQAGYTVTLATQDDGDHVAVTGTDKAGALTRWETVGTRLDQAVNRLMGFSAKEVEARFSVEG
jgi:hypothetical protein